MPSRKNNRRNSAAHTVAASLVVKVAPKGIETPKVDPTNIPAIFKVTEVMADAIRKMADKLVEEEIANAGGLQEGTSFDQWMALKAVKTAVKEILVPRIYDGKLGSIALRGIEKKAAKDCLWEAFNNHEEVARIKKAHEEYVARRKEGYDKRTNWAVNNQNNRKGRVIAESEVASYEEVQAYMARQRRANG